MMDKQAGVLEMDVYSSEKYAGIMHWKSSGRIDDLEGEAHLDFLSYLKSTCRQRNDRLFHKKMRHKTLNPSPHHMHQHLILAMRTQYEARPNS